MKNKQISLRFTDEEYQKISALATKSGLSITRIIKSSILRTVGLQMENNDLTINDVDTAAKKLATNKLFKIKQLFEPDVWNHFTKTSRLSVGHIFFESVAKGNFNDKYAFEHKDSDNSAVYRRL